MKAKRTLKSIVVTMFVLLLVTVGCVDSVKTPSWGGDKLQPNIYISSLVSIDSGLVQKMLRQSVTIEYAFGGKASGVILDSKNGVILTCLHCITDASGEPITIETYRGNRFIVDEKTIKQYPDYDMAVITLGHNVGGVSAKVRRNPAAVGELIVLIGSPYNLTHTLSVGHISAVGRDLWVGNKIKYYQTDAALNPGSSGGPWFDSKGYLIAISARKLMRGDNISFGIPIGYLE